MSKRKQEYLAYLASPEWARKRMQVFELYGRKCNRCGTTQGELHVHHNRYSKDFDSTPLKFLEVLCKRCHKAHHERKKAERRARRREERRLYEEHQRMQMIAMNPAVERAEEFRKRKLESTPLSVKVMCEVCGGNISEATRSELGDINRALKEIRDVFRGSDDDLAEEISVRASMIRASWPGVFLTPTAIARHWSKFSTP